MYFSSVAHCALSSLQKFNVLLNNSQNSGKSMKIYTSAVEELNSARGLLFSDITL